MFLPGESQGRRSLVGCRLWGRMELDKTEVTWQQQPLDQYHDLSHLCVPSAWSRTQSLWGTQCSVCWLEVRKWNIGGLKYLNISFLVPLRKWSSDCWSQETVKKQLCSVDRRSDHHYLTFSHQTSSQMGKTGSFHCLTEVLQIFQMQKQLTWFLPSAHGNTAV